MIIRNENDIYIYFEVITQLEPRKILDIGMFLKRIGSVARKVMDEELSEEIVLDGVDLFPEIDFPVWKHIYNKIYIVKDFLSISKEQNYNLAMLLGGKEIQIHQDLAKLIKVMSKHVRYLLTDILFDSLEIEICANNIYDLHVENDTYYLIDFGD